MQFAARRSFGLSADLSLAEASVSDLETQELEGLKQMVAQPLERVNVRSRGSQVTRSAWRLEASSPAGSGAIVLLELSAGESFYRGEGIFLGWSQPRLARAYEALAPRPTESEPELPQLG